MNCIIDMEGNELHLSSVIQASSPWKERATGSFLTKIVRMETDTMAIILKDDCNKPLRFVYLLILMGKRNSIHMQSLITKIGQIKLNRSQLNFRNLPHSLARLLPTSVNALHAELQELAKKLQNHSYSHNAILKMSHEFAIIDPLLIAALRTVAEDNKLSHALDWGASLGMGQTEALWSKIVKQKEKGEGLSGRNKYVLFYPLTELQLQFFRARGVTIAKESQCFEQLSDNQSIRYQQFLMIEKVYSLL